MTSTFTNLFGAYDEPYFLDLFDHLYPEWYLTPLKSPGPGYELIQAYSAIGERLGLATQHVDDCAYIMSAPLGVAATVTLFLSRPTFTCGAVTIKKGSVFTTSTGDFRFITSNDVTFGETDLGPFAVTASAEAVGYEYNVRGARLTATGVLLVGEIDTPLSLVEKPPYGDPTITVQQGGYLGGTFYANDAVNGTPAALEQHGEDRGFTYQPGESRDAFAARIRNAPDTVSIDAIRRSIVSMFDPYNVTPVVIETWEPAYQTCYDWVPPTGVETPIFVYDDPRPAPAGRYWNRWFDEVDVRGSFFVVVPQLAPIAEYGMAYDDPGLSPIDFTNVIGARSIAAYDVPVTMPQTPTPILIGAYDGIDVKKAALFAGLRDTLHNIKAGGIFATVELSGQ